MKKLVNWFLAIGLLTSLAIASCAPATVPTPAPASPPPAPAATPSAATTAQSTTAPSPKAAWEAKWDEMVAAGKKEGKVMIYGSVTPEILKELSQAFTGKYGITLEVVTLPRPAEMIAKLKTERGAGQYVADVIFHGGNTGVTELKPAGLIDPLEPVLILPEVTDSKVWQTGYTYVDEARMLRLVRAQPGRYVTRNTSQVKEGEITSFQDLLNPKWKGKIVMSDPTASGTAAVWVSHMNALWGREKAVGFLKEFVKQEPVINTDMRLPIEWVARGSYPVGVGLRSEPMVDFVRAAAPIDWMYTVEGGTLGPGSGILSVVNKRPRPNATAVFVNWLLSKEGMSVWSKADGYPTSRIDVSTDWVDPVFKIRPDVKYRSEGERDFIERDELMKLSKELFAPVLK